MKDCHKEKCVFSTRKGITIDGHTYCSHSCAIKHLAKTIEKVFEHE